MTYFLILLIFGLLPITCLWIKHPYLPRKHLQTFFMVFGGVLISSIPWEALSVNKVWIYSHQLISGSTLFGVPVEEFLFFLVAALMTATTTLILKREGEK